MSSSLSLSSSCHNHNEQQLHDFIIWNAFLAASHDAEFGVKCVPESTRFEKTMICHYVQAIYRQQKRKADEKAMRPSARVGKKIKIMFDLPPQVIMDRYNDFIGPEVFRFMVVMKTTDRDEKHPDDSFYDYCRMKFEIKYERPFLFTVSTNDDCALFLNWLDQMQLNDPDIVLLELSEAASDLNRGIQEIDDSVGCSRSMNIAWGIFLEDVAFYSDQAVSQLKQYTMVKQKNNGRKQQDRWSSKQQSRTSLYF